MLNICKASAGSGKTHKLIGTYLKFLFEGSRNGEKEPYRHILAVTFTNKATDEMKQRVMNELHLLSSGGDSDYLSELSKLKDEDWVRKSARFILVSLLNDYNGFNISTIDSFFQQVLKAFAREVGRYPSYNVELDIEAVVSRAIDEMMASLDRSDRKELLRWLVDLSVEEIEKGYKWDLRSALTELGKKLFDEEYKSLSGEADVFYGDRKAMKDYRRKLGQIRDDFKRNVMSKAAECLKMIYDAGLNPEDFTYRKSGGMYKLIGLSEGVMEISTRFKDAADAGDPIVWSGKTNRFSAEIAALFDSPFRVRLKELAEYYRAGVRSYNTAVVILRHFSELGVLSDIKDEIKRYCTENNVIILSDTNVFLRGIIDGSDTPFIYEKVGSRIDHYMLDEFQDTSNMQWDNFLPLVKDSEAQGNENLVVGDVKQSIYRWRGSDWNLLGSEIDRQFREKKKESLSDNWRSTDAIREFNNAFFAWTADKKQADCCNDDPSDTLLKKVYEDVRQYRPEKKKADTGHVKVQFVEGTEDADWKQTAMDTLYADINTLKDRGYSLNDMVVLTRKNADGQLVAAYFLEKGLSIITEDTLTVSASSCVRRLIAVLRNMQTPDDVVSAFLLKNNPLGTQYDTGLPLFDLCDTIIASLPEEERRQTAYIHTFMDGVSEFVASEGNDLKGFLEWWDGIGCKRAVSAPAGKDSIRIMTIHKSKGLGMEVVFVPFLYEPFIRKSNYGKTPFMWCCPDGEFGEARILPMNFQNDLDGTIFREQWMQERVYQIIDVLNNTYVAFTRAKRELVVYAQLPRNVAEGKSVGCDQMGNVLYNYLSSKGMLNKEYTFDGGEWTSPAAIKPEGDVVSERGAAEYVPVCDRSRLRLSLRSADIMSEGRDARREGILMHNLFSMVEKESDISAVVERAVSEGMLPQEETERMKGAMSDRICSPEVRAMHWFDGTYTLRNEVSVLSAAHGEKRPDRVMTSGDRAVVVDYKFGKNRDDRYISQVRGYMRLLSEMGWRDVRGYLWYNDEIQSVH